MLSGSALPNANCERYVMRNGLTLNSDRLVSLAVLAMCFSAILVRKKTRVFSRISFLSCSVMALHLP